MRTGLSRCLRTASRCGGQAGGPSWCCRSISACRTRVRPAAITLAVLRGLLDVLDDGVALADGDGVLVLASRRLEEMFGYEHAELAGRRLDSLIPASLREAPGHGTTLAHAAVPRPAGTGARLAGARKDGAPFPVEVRRIPVQTAAGQFTLAVVRNAAPDGTRAASGPQAATG